MLFAIHSHESAMGIHVPPSWTLLPPSSPSHPSGSSPCTGPEHPALGIKPVLVIYFTYGSIHEHWLFNTQRIVWLSTKMELHMWVYYYVLCSILSSFWLRILAWRIPWTEEPVGVQSMCSQRVRHDWVTDTHTWNNIAAMLWLFFSELFRLF